MEEGLILCDAHTHVETEGERREREEGRILSLVCACAPKEAEEVFSYKEKYLIPTCGVHPWHAGQQEEGAMEPWLKRCRVIGEIGMDSVWCSVPLDVQRQVFCRQLAMACSQKKPVILHTKGQEKEAARIIRDYPNRYLVHWYSCENYLEEYLSQDCFFSIGPDVWWNQAVKNVAGKVPKNRLLIETDGLESVKWAYEEGRKTWGQEQKDGKEPQWSVTAALTATLKTAAGILGIKPEDAGKLFRDNLVTGFLGGESGEGFWEEIP